MRRNSLFGFCMVLVRCIVGIGFYRGWFVMSGERGTDGNHTVGVHLTVDSDKAHADVKALKDKAHDLTGSSPEDQTKTTPAKTNPRE